MQVDYKNSVKSPEIYICTSCDYNTVSGRDYNKHLLTAKHKFRSLDDNKLLKSLHFSCDKCHYTCFTKSDYVKHCNTIKHNAYSTSTITNEFNTPTQYSCLCGNVYKYRQGLSKHKKICKLSNCISEPPMQSKPLLSNQIDATLVIELLKQNQEFKELMMEQSKQNTELQEQLLEAVKDGKIGNTIHNNNTTNNNKFNLNFFLNETCKDAITMSDFINSIEVTMEDFIQTGNIGFVDGISKVMVERIKVMDLHTRPMHCTDLKRETLYIKNDDKWEKEDSDKTLLRKAVKNIANKNYNQLHKWYNNSKPQVEMIGSEDCENYFKYHKAALGGYDKEEDKKFEEKIIKNVLKEVLVDKVPT